MASERIQQGRTLLVSWSCTRALWSRASSCTPSPKTEASRYLSFGTHPDCPWRCRTYRNKATRRDDIDRGDRLIPAGSAGPTGRWSDHHSQGNYGKCRHCPSPRNSFHRATSIPYRRLPMHKSARSVAASRAHLAPSSAAYSSVNPVWVLGIADQGLPGLTGSAWVIPESKLNAILVAQRWLQLQSA